MTDEYKQELPVVFAADAEKNGEAGELADRLGCLFVSADEGRAAPLSLSVGKDGLILSDGTQKTRGDFSRLLPRLRPQNLGGELLVRAAKCKECEHPVLIDATAGMGEDSFLLAAAGFTVELYERDPIIAALLNDTLERAKTDRNLAEIAARMHFHAEDSVQAMQNLSATPDVIYLDPMFPERQKSGLVKKKFQLLHHLENPCEDEEILLQAAWQAHPRKIVVKRPLKAPALAEKKPSYSLLGKAIRYDCLVPPQPTNEK